MHCECGNYLVAGQRCIDCGFDLAELYDYAWRLLRKRRGHRH